MATNEQAIHQTPPPVEAGLDEDSVVSSLARLQELHISLRSLRETIPNVMHSVLLDPPSPEQLHSNFAQAANGAAQAIKQFSQLMEDSRTKEVMENAKQSRSENSEGIIGWQIAQHGDWLDVKQEDGNDDVDKEEGDNADASDDASLSNVTAALDKFRSTHTGVDVSMGKDSVILVLPPPAQIDFQIQLEITTEGHNTYAMNSKGKSKFHGAIIEAIRARTKSNNLTYLLEMLASYVDIRSRPCVKCSRLLDRNAQFPVIRSRKKIKRPDGQFESQWQALHTACT